ncbi:MAG: DNA repair protein RecN [Actinobacteria bacterium]|nr:DNA repair protein RecN [Actinomycetota bacterium]
MIDELHIAGLGVIEDVTLPLSPGLTVVTGETGAGKTMVVTALQLLLGDRADTSLVRAGSEAAVVEARLTPVPSNAAAGGWASPDTTELIISREILPGRADGSGGRSRVRIGGRLAAVSALADLMGEFVDVHGQGSHVRLGRSDVARTLLDRYAGAPHARTLAAYRPAWTAWQEVSGQRASLLADARERAREHDRLAHELAEIDAADLDPQRDADLGEERARLEHAEQLASAAGQAAAALDEDGAGHPVGVAVAALRRAAGHDAHLDALGERTEALAAELADVRGELRTYAETVEADPVHLDELRRRERLLGDLTRKYGADIPGVLDYSTQARARLAELSRHEESAAALAEREADLAAQVHRLAGELHRGRDAASTRLAEAIEAHLADLGMAHARVRISVEGRQQPGPNGCDRVSIELAANPGEPRRPLGEGASGGERSRVALAVEVALADVEDARVLVFDEVDAGVGGATAMAVGEKLARLAVDGRQVLCVTHLPQLAAFADVHHVVEKGIRGGRTVTTSRSVEGGDRPAELARMLSGGAGRGAGVAHAQELLAEASSRRAG